MENSAPLEQLMEQAQLLGPFNLRWSPAYQKYSVTRYGVTEFLDSDYIFDTPEAAIMWLLQSEDF